MHHQSVVDNMIAEAVKERDTEIQRLRERVEEVEAREIMLMQSITQLITEYGIEHKEYDNVCTLLSLKISEMYKQRLFDNAIKSEALKEATE